MTLLLWTVGICVKSVSLSFFFCVADATDSEDMWELRQQLCMVLCDVLIDGSTPPLGLIPLRRLFVQAARRLAAARPAMQPDLVSHMLIAARRCVDSEEKSQTSDVSKVVQETMELMRSWLSPSELLDADESTPTNTSFPNPLFPCSLSLLETNSLLLTPLSQLCLLFSSALSDFVSTKYHRQVRRRA
jgi:hypothetical protein